MFQNGGIVQTYVDGCCKTCKLEFLGLAVLSRNAGGCFEQPDGEAVLGFTSCWLRCC